MSFQAMTWATAQTCGNPTTKLVLLMLANHANGHTGQCNPRHRTLASECEIRVETLKDHLRKLADLGLLEIVPQFAEGVQLPNQYRLCLAGGGGEFRPQGVGEKRTGGGGEFRPPYNQEGNQEGNQYPPTPKGECVEGFANFWKAYPKKVGKDAAETAWKRKVKTPDTIKAIMRALAEQSESDGWKKDNGQFIPNPATWLNQGRWKDDVQAGQLSAFAGVL